MASIDPIVWGTSGYVLRSRLPSWDRALGETVTEVWQGLYSDRLVKYEELKELGARSITTSVSGATCIITATWGGKVGSGSGSSSSGGGGVEPWLTERWVDDPQIAEIALARIRTWGPDGDPLSADNKARAEAINQVDRLLEAGKLAEVMASATIDNKYKKYAALKQVGITGAMRANYGVARIRTYGSEEEESGVTYANQWKVVPWSAIGAPVYFSEPKYRDLDTTGAWVLSAMEWLTMPPRKELYGTWTVTETWLGSRYWIGELYEGGTG